MVIDSHAHLGEEVFDEDRKELLARGQEAGLSAIIDICTDEATLKKGLEIAKAHPWIFLTAATTPHDVEKEGEFFFPIVEKHADRLVAIGETGLDYYYEHSPKELQQHFLRRYIQLANRVQLPLVIHCRDAFPDLFRILDEEKAGPGVLHCFTGTMDEAKQVVARGWYVSFSGIVTFKKSEELREAAAVVPLEQMLIETDSPYLAPPPHRGKRNEPAYVIEVAKTLATVKGCTLEEIQVATATNATSLFHLPTS